MANDFDQVLKALLNSDKASKLSGKKDTIQNLANSSDGQKVQQLLGNDVDALKNAVEKGDMSKLQGTLASILKTEEGARLAKQISNLMK